MEDAIVRARIRLEHEERLSWPRRLEQAALAVPHPHLELALLSSAMHRAWELSWTLMSMAPWEHTPNLSPRLPALASVAGKQWVALVLCTHGSACCKALEGMPSSGQYTYSSCCG